MKRKKLKITLAVLMGIIILIITEIGYRSFNNYEKTIVSQQEEQLLTISKLIGKSLENFVEEKEKAIDNLAENLFLEIENNNLLYIKKRLDNFNLSQSNGITAIYFLDFKDNKKISYPKNKNERFFFKNKNEFLSKLNQLKKSGNVYVGNVYKDTGKSYVFNIFRPIYLNNKLRGIVIGTLSVKDMYNKLVKPIKAGKYGYAMLKNSEGIIIMHPVEEQIGYDVLKGRKEKYPKLDYDELEELVAKQLSGKEGTYVYHSYWWTQKELKKVKKFQAFSSINITKKFWIVAVTMSYDEIKEPIKKYLYNIISVAVTLILVLSMSMFLIMRMVKTKETYKIEMNYLKELNETSEKLRKKETELHHRRKLETIGTLTGGIAHEFNNILTPIMGYSEMILGRITPDNEIYEDMKIINDSSQRARDVIDQILVFSRDKNMIIQYEVVKIDKVIKEAVKFFESTMPSNIKIIKEINEDTGNVFANETQVHQVILNLCVNAYNAMKETGGSLTITLEAVDYDKDEKLKNSELEKRKYVKISVKDTGCGMDEETIQQIFDPFFTKKLSKESSGLGLSVVMGIIVKHGGKIFVESELNKGSEFSIYLPQSDKKINIEKNNEDNEIKGTEKVLIIDDEENIAEMLKKGLNQLGYKVTCYTNGEEILKDFNIIKDKFDVIVSDIMMPGINGIQLAKKFRRNQPEVKIILMTANTEEPLEEYIQEKVIDDYLLKPISAQKIGKRIRKIIE